MYFRYNQPYNVTMGPRAHSFLEYPPVQIRPMPTMGNFIDAAGVRVTTGSPTADTVIKYGFWVGMALVAYRLYRVMRYDDPFIRPSIDWMKKAGVYKPAPMGWRKGTHRNQGGSGRPRAGTRKRWDANPGDPEMNPRRRHRVGRILTLSKAADAGESLEEYYARVRKQIVAKYEPGMSVAALAEPYGILGQTAIKWLKEAGVYAPKPRARRGWVAYTSGGKRYRRRAPK